MARTASIKINLTPEMLDRIKAAAAELGVTPSAWASIRLGEAVQAQARVAGAFESFGRNLAVMAKELELAEADGESDSDE